MHDYPKYYKIPAQGIYIKLADRYHIAMLRLLVTENGVGCSLATSSCNASLIAFFEDNLKPVTAEEYETKFAEMQSIIKNQKP